MSVKKEQVLYKGYVIVSKTHQVGEPHEQAGKWCAGEYSLEKHTGKGLEVRSYAHDPLFFDTQTQADRANIVLAKMTIDRIDRGEIIF